MKLRIFTTLLIVSLMFVLTSSVLAQEYLFSVEQEIVHAYWNDDGTLSLDYTFVFVNQPGAHVIDFVDVGLPNGSYDFNSISADVDGRSVSISSDYQGEGGFGVAVDLGSAAIQPGQRGTVHVTIGTIRNVLYEDSNEPETYTSAVFMPTYFGRSYVVGTTDISVNFHLPAGMSPEEPRYHVPSGGWPCDSQPSATYDDQNRVTYTWRCPNANMYSEYTFGTSFPKQYVPAGSIVTTPAFNFDFGAIIDNLLTYAFCCCFGAIFIGAPILGVINERKRKLKYLPPKISIEGHGVKRGLTAVEAAILMEQPLDKAMTMILFSIVKKDAATVLRRDPLEIQPASPLPEGLHQYEKDFLAAFAEKNQGPRRKLLQEMTVNLVKSIGEKMKGFSRKETIPYYRGIMERAWQQIEAAGTPEVKSQMYEEALEWTMLDKDYDNRTRRVFTGPIFVPMWWGRYDPGFGGGASPKVASLTPSVPGGRSSPSLSLPGSAVAASMVNSVQGFSSKILGDLGSFTSGVTQRTNPVPKTSSAGGSRSSGGGSSCACACAGCACACAGGGR